MLGRFNAGLGWSEGLQLSAVVAAVTSGLSLVASAGLRYARSRTLADGPGGNIGARAFESVVTAYMFEAVYRLGLYTGLLWWLSLLPVAAPIPMAAAAAVTTLLFALYPSVPGILTTYPKLPGLEGVVDRLVLGSTLAFVMIANRIFAIPAAAPAMPPRPGTFRVDATAG